VALEPEATVARGEENGQEVAATDELEGDVAVRPFAVGFVPGLGSNGWGPSIIKNHVALNALVGSSNILDGIELSGVGAVRTLDGRGFQGAGIFNITLGNFSGFQGSGIIGIAGGDFAGFQGSGVVSVVGGSRTGFQTGGIATFAGGSGSGVQGASIINVSGEHFGGVQLSAIANFAGSLSGAQFSLCNIVGHRASGFQAGLVNYSGELSGLQLGLVNVARRADGATLGLFNFVGDGLFEPGFWSSDTSWANAGLKMGSRKIYSIFGVGYQSGHDETDILGIGEDEWTSFIFGLGAHADLGRFYLDVDFVTHQIFANHTLAKRGPDMLSKLRAALGLRLLDQLSFYAGPTLNVMVSRKREYMGFDFTLWDRTVNDVNLAISPGLMVGVQLEPEWGSLNPH